MLIKDRLAAGVMEAVVVEPGTAGARLRYQEVARPTIGPDEALIRVRACGVNRLDLTTADGPWGVLVRPGHILGLEPAGDVEAVGEAVNDSLLGRRVWINPLISCGRCRDCLAGDDNLCPSLEIIGLHRPGGYAQYVVVPARNVAAFPSLLSYEGAAAMPVAFGTAWHMLVTRARVQPGENVLVIAAGSGIGSAAVQIALVRGARVIAAAGQEDKLEKARQLGAQATVNYTQRSISRAVKEFTGGRGADVVFEHVGPVTWKESVASLARNGRLVICGALTGRTVSLDLWTLFLRQHTVIGAYAGTAHDLESALELVENGQLRPVVDRLFPLYEAGLAHQYLAERRNFGKVVLQIP